MTPRTKLLSIDLLSPHENRTEAKMDQQYQSKNCTGQSLTVNKTLFKAIAIGARDQN